MYIDYDHVTSFNKPLNFIVTSRGYGKTFGFKIEAINNYIENKKHFIYIKRYDNDFKKIKTFLSGEIAAKYPDYEFMSTSREAFIRKKLTDDEKKEGLDDYPWELFGHYLRLSEWQKIKGDAYDDVTLICFDEFIKEHDTSRYLPNEGIAFKSMLDTIIRNRDDVTIFCLGNLSSVFNPLFLEFNIHIPKGAKIIRLENILVYMKVGDEFIEKRKNTLVGKLISGSSYENFSIGNNAYMDSDSYIVHTLGRNAIYKARLNIDGIHYGLWLTENGYVFSSKFSKESKNKLSFTVDKIEEDEIYVTHYSENMVLKTASRYFKTQQLLCEKQKDRDAFINFLKLSRISTIKS